MKAFRRRVTRRTVLQSTMGAVAAWAAGRLLEPAFAGGQSQDAGAAIWDAHVHLTPGPGTVEQRVDRLLTCADRMGIERLVVFMGATWAQDPTPDQLHQQNDDVLPAPLPDWPKRILGMLYLNPKHTEASLEMDRCLANGPMVGVKLWIAMKCDRPELDPIVRRAVELQVPLVQHAYWRVMGNWPGESGPMEVAALAARHPDAHLICAHTGNDWERGVRAIRPYKNVMAEVSGCDPTAGMVEMAVCELGADRVIYGSDAGGRSFASQLAKVYSAELPVEARRKILGGNIRRLLQPILAQKGAVL